MQFHHEGYVSGEPRVLEAAGYGIDRAAELPEEMDVLIVGSGPAGMIAAAQLSKFPSLNVRMIERRGGRLELGQADGVQARSVESFNAFGFAERIIAEAYRITEMAIWNPNPDNRDEIIRTGRTLDDEGGTISEFPHLIVNQARVLDYFAEVALRSPGRITPDYGWEFQSLTVHDEGEYPVEVKLVGSAGDQAGVERTVRAKYVVGCDGASSRVRKSIGRRLEGDAANHAWGVMDVIAKTDFPDWRLKATIHSKTGSILHIPREGGHLARIYVDLGEVPLDDNHAVRSTPIEEVIRRANEILSPYTLDVQHVAWSSVYEVGHRVTDKFDDVDDVSRSPRVFVTGDACHTHSAKAGQGMNVSMQDGWNIAWKLGFVLEGRSPASLLHTYSGERQEIAQNLIDFDKQWSSMMAKKPEEFESPDALERFYEDTFEFPAGFMTQYKPSVLTAGDEHQELAAGLSDRQALQVCQDDQARRQQPCAPRAPARGRRTLAHLRLRRLSGSWAPTHLRSASATGWGRPPHHPSSSTPLPAATMTHGSTRRWSTRPTTRRSSSLTCRRSSGRRSAPGRSTPGRRCSQTVSAMTSSTLAGSRVTGRSSWFGQTSMSRPCCRWRRRTSSPRSSTESSRSRTDRSCQRRFTRRGTRATAPTAA